MSNSNTTTIAEALEAKAEMEREILTAASNALVEFKAKTGLSVEAIWINMIDTTCVGSAMRERKPASVSVELAL